MAKSSPGGHRKSDEEIFVEHVAAVTHGDKTLLNVYLDGYQAATEQHRVKGRAIMNGSELAKLVEDLVERGFSPGVAERIRLDAVRELSRLNLPVGEPEDLERESVPHPDDLLP